MFYRQKGFVILILLFLASSCCLEEYSEYEWEIVNNSNDTIFIASLQFLFSDSIAILPHEVFKQIVSDDGKDKRFSCANEFKLSKVRVSGGKTLTRTVDDDINWIHSSDYSTCKAEHKCSFKIEQTDIR
jgi:hypothetical protein